MLVMGGKSVGSPQQATAGGHVARGGTGLDLKTASAVLSRMRHVSSGSSCSMESDLSRSWGSSTGSYSSAGPYTNNSHSNGPFSSNTGYSSRNGHYGAASSGFKVPHSIRECDLSVQPPNINQQHHSTPQQSSQQLSNSKISNENNPKVANPGRYKTEMCRPFAETGHCKYGEKCQFAHGDDEMRGLPRHPKFKTELCRTFHTSGFCPYGPRCHFIHSEDEGKLVEISQKKHQQAAKEIAQQTAQVQARQHALQTQMINILLSQAQNQISSQTSLTNPTIFPSPLASDAPSLLPRLSPTSARFIFGSTVDSPPDSPADSLSSDDELTQSPVLPSLRSQLGMSLLTSMSSASTMQAAVLPEQPLQGNAVSPDELLTSADGVLNLDHLSSFMDGLNLDYQQRLLQQNQYESNHQNNYMQQNLLSDMMNNQQASTMREQHLSSMEHSSSNPMMATSQMPTPPAAVIQQQQELSETSSPDSLCSSMDSGRGGSRLPVFSQLAAHER